MVVGWSRGGIDGGDTGVSEVVQGVGEGGEVGQVEAEDVRVGSAPAAQFETQDLTVCYRRRC